LRDSESYNFGQLQLAEGEVQRGSCAFGRVSFSPCRRCQTPCDFYRWGEGCFKRRDGETDEAGELCYAGDFDGPGSEAVERDMVLRAIEQRIAFVGGESGREVLHHFRVGIESGKWKTIRFPPVPQQEPCGTQFPHRALEMENAALQGNGDRVSAVRGFELGEDILHVNLYGAAGGAQLFGDLFVAKAARHQAEDFHFAFS